MLRRVAKKVAVTGMLVVLTSLSVQGSALAETAGADKLVNPDVGVPVFPYDITDRPYDVVGTVEAKVRKATIFSKEASQSKIYRELWERASKLGADAVVKAEYGNSHVTALSWGSTTATGIAIKFKAAAPAEPAAEEPAAQ